MAALQAGEPKAAAEIYHEFAPLVRRVLRRVMGPRVNVSDEVQESFVVLYEKLPTLRDPEALESFLYGISLNVARRELQRRRRWWLPGSERAVERTVSNEDAIHEARPALEALYRILDDLDPDSRLAFVVRYVEGLELTDAAEVLGVSLATAKRRIRKSRDLVWARARSEPRLRDHIRCAQKGVEP